MAAPRQDSKLVRRAIDEGKIPPVWFWAGPEAYLKNDLFDRLVEKMIDPSLASLNVSRFRAGDDKVDEVVGVASTIPMLGERRAVFYRDLDRLGVKERRRLLDYVASPAPETALVLAGEWGDEWRAQREEEEAVSAFRAAGAVVALFASPGDPQKRDWIRLRLRESGKECSEATASAFLEACRSAEDRSPALWEIAPELEKVVLTVGARAEVTEEDLRVIGRKADEEQLREIARHVDERDLAGALRALDGALLFRENRDFRVVSQLAFQFARKLRQRDRRYSGDEVVRALRVLARADRELKSSQKDSRVVLERMLAAICRP